MIVQLLNGLAFGVLLLVLSTGLALIFLNVFIPESPKFQPKTLGESNRVVEHWLETIFYSYLSDSMGSKFAAFQAG